MRLRIFIAAVSLLCVAKAHACWGPHYTPDQYYVFRASDNARQSGLRLRNCELWQEQTSKKIPLEEIEKVVYDFTLADLVRVSQLVEGSGHSDSILNNKFVSWIVRWGDKEIIDFLLLAKECEQTRFEMASPWYYPVEDDDASTILRDVAKRAMANKTPCLRDRYALQAVRAMLATAQYGQLINFWNDSKVGKGLMREMILPYVAGAYLRAGNVEQAKQLYAECGDLQSLFLCEDRNLPFIDRLKLVYQYSPDSPALAEMLQGEVHAGEGYGSSALQPIYAFARQVIAEGKAADMALWHYTAAFIANDREDFAAAAQHARRALSARGSRYVKESARVLQILVDAQAQPLNAAYEQRLLAQLRWLDGKIADDIADNVVEQTTGWCMRSNISYYYWNDMLRKIALGVLAPRYAAAGNHVRAIQLANMADHRLPNLVDKTPLGNNYFAQMRESTSDWSMEYSSELFSLLDSTGVDGVVAYTRRLARPQGAFDRFVNSRSLTDRDYFNEIIGTLCLREMRYAEAVEYFERVPASFQYTLNVWKEGCMRRDPFDGNGRPWTLAADRSDYKLRFAREMVSLERTMHGGGEPNRRAQAQIRYAVGMLNSVDFAWALTQYSQGTEREWRSISKAEVRKFEDRYQKLLREAFAMFTDDETAAQSRLALGYITSIMRHYPQTAAADYLRTHCDHLADYKGR